MFWLKKGIHDGIPIALGYLSVGFTLGITARHAGLTPFQATITSLFMNASAGEFAGFTMISGLLIIILERTQMIGILKALGANDFTIRKVFLWFSVFLIGKGMLWGNAIGIVFCILQSQFGLFKLDPETYYVSMVPVSMNIWLFLLINAGTLLTSVLMLVGPSYLITKINPADSMRYE